MSNDERPARGWHGGAVTLLEFAESLNADAVLVNKLLSLLNL